MSEQYGQAVASHYAAYRPPLHQVILKRVFFDSAAFSEGLDLGCGTGYSATALVAYCAQVYGVDPSPSMLDEAPPHDKITYLEGAAENIPLPNGSVDVATLAGSLFYAGRDATAEELKRVCRKKAIIAPYDFEVLMDDVLKRRGIAPERTESDYDHSVNFAGVPGFTERISGRAQVNLEVTASELSHVLLSDLRRYEAFADKYGAKDPFPKLEGELKSESEQPSVTANIYYAKYELSSKGDSHAE